MEGAFIILLVLGAIVFAGALFCVWVVVAVVRWFAGLISPKHRPPPLVPQQQARGAVQVCRNPQCKCGNPAHARFCRRCGRSLPSLMRVVSSRAAVL